MLTNPHKRMVTIISSVLIAAGILFLVLSLIPGGGMNITLPLVFLMLGAAFITLTFVFSPEYRWAAFLYVPGCLLLTFGVIFLLNTLTGDWTAWAYAWLLLLSGAGLGMILAVRRLALRREILLVSQAVVFLGITLFALFGVIAGGLFIQVMAPVLLVIGGLALRWSGLEKTLAQRGAQDREADQRFENPGSSPPLQPGLIEPLSRREIEVLRLIDQGLSNAEIASRLTLAQSTVKTHINNIYGKLNVETRVQAIKRGYDLGLLEHKSPR